jgi:hypothetical protein
MGSKMILTILFIKFPVDQICCDKSHKELIGKIWKNECFLGYYKFFKGFFTMMFIIGFILI